MHSIMSFNKVIYIAESPVLKNKIKSYIQANKNEGTQVSHYESNLSAKKLGCSVILVLVTKDMKLFDLSNSELDKRWEIFYFYFISDRIVSMPIVHST